MCTNDFTYTSLCGTFTRCLVQPRTPLLIAHAIIKDSPISLVFLIPLGADLIPLGADLYLHLTTHPQPCLM